MQWEIRKFKKAIDSLKQMGAQNSLALNEQEAQDLKQRVLRMVANQEQEDRFKLKPKSSIISKGQNIVRYAFSLLLGLSLAGGTTFASSTAVPGDWLYGVKRFKEKIELQIASSNENKAGLKVKQAQERLAELQIISGPKMPEQESLPAQNGEQANEPASKLSGENLKNSRAESEIESRAKIEARKAIDEAVSAVEAAQVELRQRGREQSAKDLDKEIFDLKNRAQAQGVSARLENRESEPRGRKKEK